MNWEIEDCLIRLECQGYKFRHECHGYKRGGEQSASSDRDTVSEYIRELEKVNKKILSVSVEDAKDADRYRWLRDNFYINEYSNRKGPYALIKIRVIYNEDTELWMKPGKKASVGIPSLNSAVDAALAEGKKDV